MSQRTLSLAKIAQLTKTGSRVTKPACRQALDPVCDHQFQPDKTIITSPGLKEFPTKRCSLCNLWLCLQPNEVQEEAITDMGNWLG